MTTIQTKKIMALILATVLVSLIMFSGCNFTSATKLTTENFGEYFDISLSLENLVEANNSDVAGFFASHWEEADLCINVINIKKVEANDVEVTLKINIKCDNGWYVVNPKNEIQFSIPYDGKVEKRVPYKVKCDYSPLLSPTIDDISFEIISVSGTV